MKKAPFQLTLVLAGVIAAGTAAAGPYDSWSSVVSDDDAGPASPIPSTANLP